MLEPASYGPHDAQDVQEPGLANVQGEDGSTATGIKSRTARGIGVTSATIARWASGRSLPRGPRQDQGAPALDR